MSFLVEPLIFGPIKSRRLGNSLGVNLLPEVGKICSFNCIYCECGWNPENKKNSETGKKAEAKSIADIVDATMLSMKFSRNMRSQIPNIDRAIYRVTMRFEAVVGEPIVASSGTTTLQMYRV